MRTIFTDSDLKNRVSGNILLEGATYYIDTSEHSRGVIEQWLLDEQLYAFTTYHSRNPVVVLKLDNVVGVVNILGEQFEVRSTKLLDGHHGNDQFKLLLDEVMTMSSQLTFNLKGVSFGKRERLFSHRWNELEMLDYYYQLVFQYPKNSNLEALLNQCIRHPNVMPASELKTVPFHKSRQIVHRYWADVARFSTFSNLKEGHHLTRAPLAKKVAKVSGKTLIPDLVLNKCAANSRDTRENQFLKYFLQEIQTICQRVLLTHRDRDMLRKATLLHHKIIRLLQNPFFEAISSLSIIPGSSSVLLMQSGYREIYYHYIQSKLDFRPLIAEQGRILHNARLKNIATLYEIWVFYKLASVWFSDETITETFLGRTLEHGTFLESYKWESKSFKLYYNKTFSRKNKGAYSVNLRPDIALETADGTWYLFDAKYKFASVPGDDDNELLRVVKAEDVHKMHTYLEAIDKAKAAVVIYPGTETVFYEKTGDVYHRPFDIFAARGVGAIPLIPRTDSTRLSTYFNRHALQ
jgi:hypothetical protein